MSTSREPFVLLLTATIDPGATLKVARRDPLIRLRDYQQALTAWLRSDSIHRIVLYENTGYDLSSLRAIADGFPQHQVELHSFVGNESGAAKGKGYSELSGIVRTIAASQLIGPADLIVKCTGRLSVANAGALFPAIQRQMPFDVMCMMKGNFTMADSRLFVVTPQFMSQYLVTQQNIINDAQGVYFEHALACATARALSDRLRWLPFPLFPRIVGVSGSLGYSLGGGFLRQALQPLHHRLRNLMFSR